ncbi:MAG: P1 family peptidase [bacterium]
MGVPARKVLAQQGGRPRARDLGVVVGVFPTGKYNAITDVKGVRVGHATVIQGDSIHTGVTAIIPQGGDLYREPVPAWIHVGNGYGKLVGETQVREFGEIETPILLTCTLCVWSAAEALVNYLLAQPGETQHTINPIVGETNDSRVNDMWSDPIRPEHVREALENASDGVVEEGSVGAGTGTRAFNWKGGIGTSSRVLPRSLGGYTVGVLVQTNFGGMLSINGAPVGRELREYDYRQELEAARAAPEAAPQDDGSIMIVLATDAPLAALNLDRLARRAIMGLARTGSFASNSSGDYVIAFSTAKSVRRRRSSAKPLPTESLLNPSMSPLFAATAEATEEAIYNAIFRATTVSGRGRTLKALPIDRTVQILRKYNALNWDKELSPGRH